MKVRGGKGEVSALECAIINALAGRLLDKPLLIGGRSGLFGGLYNFFCNPKKKGALM